VAGEGALFIPIVHTSIRPLMSHTFGTRLTHSGFVSNSHTWWLESHAFILFYCLFMYADKIMFIPVSILFK